MKDIKSTDGSLEPSQNNSKEENDSNMFITSRQNDEVVTEQDAQQMNQ